MPDTAVTPILEHQFDIVNPQFNSQLPLFSDSVIHHKYHLSSSNKKIVYKRGRLVKTYGVSPLYRVLSPQLLLRKFDLVRHCLIGSIGLTPAQVEATMRLLRLWAYYGAVYPKASQVATDFNEQPAESYFPYPGYQPPKRRFYGCSRATYWRAIRRLRDLGLIRVINRFIIRPHAQISNLYRLDKLMVVLARYLAEHGVGFMERWLQPYLTMPGSQFWGGLSASFGSGCRGSPAACR